MSPRGTWHGEAGPQGSRWERRGEICFVQSPTSVRDPDKGAELQTAAPWGAWHSPSSVPAGHQGSFWHAPSHSRLPKAQEGTPPPYAPGHVCMAQSINFALCSILPPMEGVQVKEENRGRKDRGRTRVPLLPAAVLEEFFPAAPGVQVCPSHMGMVAWGGPSTSDPKTPQTHPFPCVGDLLLPTVPSGKATEPTRTHGAAPAGSDETPGTLRADALLGGLWCHAAKGGGPQRPPIPLASLPAWDQGSELCITPGCPRPARHSLSPGCDGDSMVSAPGFWGCRPCRVCHKGHAKVGPVSGSRWKRSGRRTPTDAHAAAMELQLPYGEHETEPARGAGGGGGGGEDGAPPGRAAQDAQHSRTPPGSPGTPLPIPHPKRKAEPRPHLLPRPCLPRPQLDVAGDQFVATCRGERSRQRGGTAGDSGGQGDFGGQGDSPRGPDGTGP